MADFKPESFEHLAEAIEALADEYRKTVQGGSLVKTAREKGYEMGVYFGLRKGAEVVRNAGAVLEGRTTPKIVI